MTGLSKALIRPKYRRKPCGIKEYEQLKFMTRKILLKLLCYISSHMNTSSLSSSGVFTSDLLIQCVLLCNHIVIFVISLPYLPVVRISSSYQTIPEILRWHSRYCLLMVILIPHQCLGGKMSFGRLFHLFSRTRNILIFQIHFVPVVLVPTCKREKKWGIVNVDMNVYAQNRLEIYFMVVRRKTFRVNNWNQ